MDEHARRETSMINTKFSCLVMLAITIALGTRLVAQVQTDVPPVVPGAKPVTIEHIKVHGTALEGNLEGDVVDRDVFEFLPPSYAKKKSQRYPLYMPCTVIRLAPTLVPALFQSPDWNQSDHRAGSPNQWRSQNHRNLGWIRSWSDGCGHPLFRTEPLGELWRGTEHWLRMRRAHSTSRMLFGS